MRKIIFAAFFLAAVSLILFVQLSCTQQADKKPLTQAEMVARGKYLVNSGGCSDCHTPKIYTDMGPVPDTTKLLAGYYAGEKLPWADLSMIEPGKWVMTEQNFSAWLGPWGISYAANLTPDNATGIGAMSEEMFIKTLREGKWMGVGRPLIPPMPWQGIGTLDDQDLKCMYAYLQSIKPIHNPVPQPTPPDKVAEMIAKK
jgi:mono/diheme cytochrome c family protein